MSPEEVRLLFDYNAWANQRALDSAATLTAEQFTKPMGSSFSSVRDTLAHILGAQQIWLQRFQGHSPSAFPEEKFEDVASLRGRWQEQEQQLQQYVSTLTQEDLNKTLEYRTMKFGTYKNPLWQSLQHLVNHGTYHRGQIVTLLRQLNAQLLSSDLMHFYRERAQAAGA